MAWPSDLGTGENGLLFRADNLESRGYCSLAAGCASLVVILDSSGDKGCVPSPNGTIDGTLNEDVVLE